MSRPFTEKEVRSVFLDQVRCLVQYWSEQEGSKEDCCQGVAFSIMNIFDGCSGGLPAFDIIVRPHPDDKQFHIDEDENYFEDGMLVNDCMLHEILIHGEQP